MKKLEVWTFETCPFCVRVKRLFDKLNIEYTEYMIPNGDPRLGELEEKTGCGTLPQVFADGEFIGDCSKMYDLYREGKLMEVIGK